MTCTSTTPPTVKDRLRSAIYAVLFGTPFFASPAIDIVFEVALEAALHDAYDAISADAAYGSMVKAQHRHLQPIARDLHKIIARARGNAFHAGTPGRPSKRLDRHR
jgi:hypothetical protein